MNPRIIDFSGLFSFKNGFKIYFEKIRTSSEARLEAAAAVAAGDESGSAKRRILVSRSATTARQDPHLYNEKKILM